MASSYFQEMLTAVAAHGPGYKPPNVNQLREGLLDAEHASVKAQVDSLHKSNLEKLGCTVASDGWSDTQNRPLLNIMWVTTSGAVFAKSIDTSGEIKVCLCWCLPSSQQLLSAGY